MKKDIIKDLQIQGNKNFELYKERAEKRFKGDKLFYLIVTYLSGG
jgi:hypothetical protein